MAVLTHIDRATFGAPTPEEIAHDEIYTTPAAEMENLKLYGWTGTYKKCFCPVCSTDKRKRGGGEDEV